MTEPINIKKNSHSRGGSAASTEPQIDSNPVPYDPRKPITLLLIGDSFVIENVVQAYADEKYISQSELGMKRLRIKNPVEGRLEMHLLV